MPAPTRPPRSRWTSGIGLGRTTNVERLVDTTYQQLLQELSLPAGRKAIENVADHLLVVQTLEEADADTVIDSLM